MINKRQLMSFICVVFLGFTAQAKASEKIVIKGNDTLSELDTYEQYRKLFESPNVFSTSEIKSIPNEVKSIALYRMNDRRNRKLNAQTYTAIEQLIVEKFLNNSRIDVKECMECKTTRVVMAEDRFSVLRRVASNDKLTAMGKKLKVDGFLMWDAYVEDQKIFFNARIVSSEKGSFLWAKQYLLDTEQPTKWMFNTSLWGLEATRKSTNGGSTQSMNSVLALGLRTIEGTTLSDQVSYGYGFNFFVNPGQRDYFDITGMSVNVRATFELDSLFSEEAKPYGNYGIYGGTGVALVSGTPAYMLQGGAELRFNRRQHLNLGFVYMQENEVELINADGYDKQGTFGGFGYDLSIGIRF